MLVRTNKSTAAALLLCAFLTNCDSSRQEASPKDANANDGFIPLEGSTGGQTAAGGRDSTGTTQGGAFASSGGTIEGTTGSGFATGGAKDKNDSNSGGQIEGSGGLAEGENPVGGSGPTIMPMHFDPVPVDELPIIEELPDPLTMNDGTKVTSIEHWRARREEMIRILEDYTYGHMPPPPGNVSAATAIEPKTITTQGGHDVEYRVLRLSFGPNQELGFDMAIFTPLLTSSSGSGLEGGHPVLLSLASGIGENSIGGAVAALNSGFAVVTVPYQQLGADSPDYLSTGFFPAYPDYDFRDFSAWAWGISRAVDYLITDPTIDSEKIAITGVSRLGQAVLLAGAIDERIAMSAPVAGGMAFRFSGKEMGDNLGQGITEVVDQNTYWFGPVFEEFRNRTTRLPSDQHWLPALTAPRLFIMCNSLEDPYGRAYAAAQSYLGAKPVYEFLNADKNLGQNFRPGGHGATTEDWSAIVDFADQYLLGKSGTRSFDVLPPADQLP